MNYCGLDVSSSVIGISVMDEDEKLIMSKCLIMDPKETLEQRAAFFEQDFKTLVSKYKFDKVYIEEPAKAFGGGASTAHTIGILQRFNGMVSYVVFKHTNLMGEMINARSARKIAGIPHVRDLKKDLLKKYLARQVQERYNEFVIGYTPKGNLKKGVGDRADAIITCIAGIRRTKENEKESNTKTS